MAAKELYSSDLINDANLEGYYRLENVNDSSGNSRTLTNNGTVSFNTMKFNNGADLGDNNSAKYLSIANSYNLNTSNTGSHSMCGWINLYSGFGTEHISHSIINGGRDIAFRVVGGYIGIEVYDGSTTQTVTDNTTALTAGVTYHVGYKFALNVVTLYVNGLPVFSGSVSNNGTVGTTAFALGRHASVATAFLEGKIDDWAIFSRALTDVEFLAIYRIGTNTYSLQFTGSNYARKLSPTGLYGKAQFTMETWVRFTSINSGTVQSLVVIGTVAGVSVVVAQLYRESGNKFQGFFGAGGGATSIYSTTTPVADQWYHLAVTYDGSNLRLYLGTDIGDDASDATAVALTGTMNTPGIDHDIISMGVRGLTSKTSLDNYLSGYIDETRIWDTALSLAQINANKYKKLIGTEANLIGLWNHNDGSGATTTDVKGVNNLTLTGTPTWSTTTPFDNYLVTDGGAWFMFM